jgi:transketolase
MTRYVIGALILLAETPILAVLAFGALPLCVRAAVAGNAGEVICMTSIGASAPAEGAFAHFGFTPQRVAEAGRRVAERLRG